MAIQKFEDDLNIISKLGDNPGTDNGLTTPQFRAMFDKAGLMIQKFINDVILPAMNASNNPQEGLSMQGGINMNGQVLNGIKAPGAADDAANKQYVDKSAKELKQYVDESAEELKQYVDDGFHKSDWLPTAEEIGAVSIDLLWENASPQSAFAAQTVLLDLTGYDYIFVQSITTNTTKGDGNYQPLILIPNLVGASGAISSSGSSGDSVFWFHDRYATIASNGVTFSNGHMFSAGGGNTHYPNRTDRAIPVIIYGIKGVTT